MAYTHYWSFLHHSSFPLSISTSNGLQHFLLITLYFIIFTSHGLTDCRSWLCFYLHLQWTPLHSAEVIKYLIYTSYELHQLLIIATLFIITSFNLHLHLPWTSTISPYNSVCNNLHLSWTTRQQKANYVWISTSHGLLYTVQKRCMFETPPPIDSPTLSRRFYIMNLHLQCLLRTSPIVGYW